METKNGSAVLKSEITKRGPVSLELQNHLYGKREYVVRHTSGTFRTVQRNRAYKQFDTQIELGNR